MDYLAHRKAKLFSAVLAALLFTVSLGHNAFAKSRDVIDVSFKELHVTQRKNSVVVAYKIKKHDWKNLKHAHIRPRLTLYSDGYEYTTDTRLKERKGEIVFTRTRLHTKRVQVRLSGKSRYARIGELGYNSQCAKRVSVKVHYKHKKKRKQRKGWSAREYDQILDTCGRLGIGRNRCHQLADKHGTYAPKAFAACERETRWASEFKSCVNLSSNNRGKNVGKVIAACGAATTWASELNACLSHAGNLGSGAAQAVAACDAATQWSSELNTCLDNAQGLGRHAGTTIRACDDATRWASELNACVKRAKGISGNPARVIRACGEATQWDSEFKSCIKNAKGLQRPAKVIAACSRHTQWNSEFNACLRDSRPLANAEEWVNYCGERTRWNSDFKRCLAGRDYAAR